MKCALCEDKKCHEGKDCTDEDITKQTKDMYKGNNYEIMKTACHIEAEYYMKKTRLEELILFAKKMGYKRLGMAFCIGLEKEAKTINQILKKDFEIYSVCCKVCGLDKDEFDLQKLHGLDFEAACNPIGQANVLNKENTDLNIIVGLCIGHDILFTEHSGAPVTTLAVKDRVLAHNPLGAIYSKYYLENIFHITNDKEEQK
jgi:uncharacterized metal-binding protein